MSLDDTILLGAVAYDPKVVANWEGIRDFFVDCDCPLDFVLFSNYERQVKSLLNVGCKGPGLASVIGWTPTRRGRNATNC